jgi:predicted ATPase
MSDDFRSEVRESDLRALNEKVAGDNYGKYLRRLTLKRVRSFENRAVSFDFPVTALVGPNGGGKTTVLGAAGLIYKVVPPRRFFARSGQYDAGMMDWAIEYELIDKDLSRTLTVQRTASYRRAKWNRNAEARDVLIFGVERTLPATERRELVKAVGNNFTAAREVALDASVAESVGAILGKKIEGYNNLFLQEAGQVSLLSGQNSNGDGYSEFHFGAGEASVIRIVSQVESASENSLILIEEIENGLHPVATRRMVEYLIGVASRKSAQIIFTTHSNDALDPLPYNAIWATFDGTVMQGKLNINALRTITGQIDAKLAIFVEDEFAELWIKTLLRFFGGVEGEAIKVHGMGGAVPAIKVHEQHNFDPTNPFPSICVLDGDQGVLADPARSIYTLPGPDAPEAHVFAAVHDQIDQVAARLAVALQLPSAAQDRVRDVVRARAITNLDRHVIFQQIGDDLDFLSGYTVANAFLAVWANSYPDAVHSAVQQFADVLPMQGG